MDDWLATKALQHQEKHLSATRVLIGDSNSIVGYFTLTTTQIEFGDLPAEFTKKLPRRALPAAVLAWLGVATPFQGQGLGRRLLSQALRDCYLAGQTFAFVAILVDCIDDAAKAFYQQFDFSELPGHPYRLFLSAGLLERLILSDGS